MTASRVKIQSLSSKCLPSKNNQGTHPSIINEDTMMFDMVAMCSPFRYTPKQYHKLRLFLIEYINFLKLLLNISQDNDRLSTHHDHLISICNSMQALLQRMNHTFRKAVKSKQYVRKFCDYQVHLLSHLNWLQLEQTLEWLTGVLPFDDDYICPICLRTLKKPMVFESCHHRFCSKCTDFFFSSHHANQTTETYPHYHSPSSSQTTKSEKQEIKCPVCRTLVHEENVRLDVALNNFLRLYFPTYLPWWKRARKMSRQAGNVIVDAWLSAATVYYPVW